MAAIQDANLCTITVLKKDFTVPGMECKFIVPPHMPLTTYEMSLSIQALNPFLSSHLIVVVSPAKH